MNDDAQNDDANDLSPSSDATLRALAAARPGTGLLDDPRSPAAQVLLVDIVRSTPTRSVGAKRSRRVRVMAGAVSVAAAIVVAVVAVNTVGVNDGHVVVRQQPAAADVAAIARASATAFAHSGRATVVFDTGEGAALAARGTSQIEYSGTSLDVALHFTGPDGFDARNRTVGGQFYLYDGPIGAKHWIHDTTGDASSADIFDLDPRKLLDVLTPSAGFVVVGTESAPTGPVQHLHATNLSALPTLHLALGPIPGHDITGLDVWVGTDRTVQKLALTTKHTESNEPPCFVQNGVKQCLKPGDQLQKVGGRITIIPAGSPVDPKDGPARIVEPAHPSTTTGSYTVTFRDLGAPISIVAPAGAVDVAGKG